MTAELWLISALVFGAALLAVQGAYWLLVGSRTERKAINRRLALGERLDNQMEVLETLRRERGLAAADSLPFLRGLHELATQSGLKIDTTRLLIWALALGVTLLLVLSYALGFGAVALASAALLTVVGIYLILAYARHKRIHRFGEQLPDALDVLVRGLRAGHPFRVSLGLVAREMPDPIGTEFGLLADEIAFGLDVDTAVDNLCRRVGHEDLAFFAVSVNIQNRTGGNLAEVLGRLSVLIRQRIKLRLKIRAITSEGRLSGIFLSLAPFILFLIISLLSPDYFTAVADHPIIMPALVLGLLLIGAGNFIMYRMVNFKV
jgi:tight adherence protein B